MENHHPDSIPVQVGEETLYSKLSLRAVDNAETRHNYKIRFSDLQDPSMSSLARLAWVSFLHDQPDLSFDDFCEYDIPLAEIMEISGKAITSLTEGSGSGSSKAGKGKPRPRKR